MSKKQPVCPKCGQDDGLSVEVKIDHELVWRGSSYGIGKRALTGFYLPTHPEKNDLCTCGNCGWQGPVSDLKVIKRRYEIKLHLETTDEVNAEGLQELIEDSLWKVKAMWSIDEDEKLDVHSVLLAGEVK